jgi:hypothetical protein
MMQQICMIHWHIIFLVVPLGFDESFGNLYDFFGLFSAYYLCLAAIGLECGHYLKLLFSKKIVNNLAKSNRL